MAATATESSKRVLQPIERVSEILFGLIMVLTFTGSLSVAEVGRDTVHTMLIAALGCNLAWGLIDGVFYLMGSLAEKARALMIFVAVRRADRPEEAHRLIGTALPPLVAAILQPPELDTIGRRLRTLSDPPARVGLGKRDWLGAAAVFLLVFCSTLPVVIPFLIVHDPVRALRVSNGIAIALLFLTGCAFGRAIGRNPWATGLSMVLLGGVLVALTIALGG